MWLHRVCFSLCVIRIVVATYVKFDVEVVHKCVYKFSVDFLPFNFKWCNGMTIRQCESLLVEITCRNGLLVRNFFCHLNRWNHWRISVSFSYQKFCFAAGRTWLLACNVALNCVVAESNKEISVRLGVMWKNLSVDTKESYYTASRQADEEHKRKYPGYYYSPKEARMNKMHKHNLALARKGHKPVDAMHLVKVSLCCCETLFCLSRW